VGEKEKDRNFKRKKKGNSSEAESGGAIPTPLRKTYLFEGKREVKKKRKYSEKRHLRRKTQEYHLGADFVHQV